MKKAIRLALKQVRLLNQLNRLYWRLVAIATENFYKDMLNPRIAKKYFGFLFPENTGYKGLALEVGCGSGCNIFALNRMGVMAYGIDIKENLNLWGLMKDKFLIADAYRIPFGDNIFDKVFCIAVLEHLKDDTLALLEIRRVLKDKGEVVFMVPNILSSRNKIDDSHFREYTIEEIKGKLFKNNFFITRVKTRYAYSPLFPRQINAFLSLFGFFGFNCHWNLFNFIGSLVLERKRAHIYINALKEQ